VLVEVDGFVQRQILERGMEKVGLKGRRRSGRNGGAMIVDKFSGKKTTKTQTTVETGQRRPAACSERITA
jgi:hypothetical protein